MTDHSLPPLDSVDDHSPTAPSHGTPASDIEHPWSVHESLLENPELYSTPHPRTAPSPVQSTYQPQPVGSPVNTAVDQTSTANPLDPELLKQLTEHITDQVIKNLQAANIGGTGTFDPFNSQQAQQDVQPTLSAKRFSTERASLQSSIDSLSPRFTPPSPQQQRYDRNASPERTASDAGSVHSGESKPGWRSFVQVQSRGTAPPCTVDSYGSHGLHGSHDTNIDDSAPSRRRSSIGQTTSSQDPWVFQGTHNNTEAHESNPSRPVKSPPPSEDRNGATTLEKIWQPLFDDNGEPTARLGQLLRGLAKHILDDYEPKPSLVITPLKMVRFLDETKVAEEHYPWGTIFGGKLHSDSISKMYRKLHCEHHFVQPNVQEAPSVPGLTPSGFQTFMTCLIQAHPDTEFDRLTKALIEMPISNADNPRERFPKQLPRRLLPREPEISAEQRIISSLAHESVLVQLERRASAMPPPPAPPQQSSSAERGRDFPSQTKQGRWNVDDDAEDDLTPLRVPIERERKPYYAREGTGKKYDTDGNREYDRHQDFDRDVERNTKYNARDPFRPIAGKYAERPEPSTSRWPRRNSSNTQRSTSQKSNTHDRTAMPPPNRRRMSSGPLPAGPPANNFGYARNSRQSPPPDRGFTHSDPSEVGHVPPSQYASNIHPGQRRDLPVFDMDDDSAQYSTRRPSDERSMAYATDDSMRARPLPPPRNLSNVHSGYGTGYGAASSPPGDHLVPRGGVDDRARDWNPGIGLSGHPGGSDGYGSGAYGSSAHT